MPYKVGFVDNSNGVLAHYNLLTVIRHFCGGFGDIGTIGGTHTGDGTLTAIEASPTSVTETWTLTCTAGGATGTFSVVGSVSGAMAAATVGTPYSAARIAFTLTDGAVDFVIGDTFTIPVTQGATAAAGVAYEVLLYDAAIAQRELIMKAPGLSGLEEIFMGFKTYQDNTQDYYNLIAATYAGYVPGNTFYTHPSPKWSGVPAHNERIDYWLFQNGQRLVFVWKVGVQVYMSGYVGKMLPYARPSQYPYPAVCGGMLNGTPATRYSDTTMSCPFKGNRANFALRKTDGTWATPESYPWNNYVMGGIGWAQTRETEGSYPLYPIVLSDANGVYGELDGVFFVSGFENLVESTVTVGGVTYLVVRDVYRTSFSDYFAVRMD